MTTRRIVLGLLAGVPLLAVGARSDARQAVIPRLIKQAREHGNVSQRIDFISRALLGTRYQAHTLIGGPGQKEQFVLRDDAFDCVTYCEAVLAGAIAGDYAEYQSLLRRIRYAQGEVRWAERNHDFAQWSRRIVENRICRPVGIAPVATVEKTLNGDGLGKRRYAISAVATPTLMANRSRLQAGDVIGFVSRRAELDFFHTGFIAFRRGALMLRHASQSRGKVVDDEMASFVAATGVQYVTLLRAQEPEPAAQS
ncbi:MAG TPA: N-acetylmuramoyl-L-alanine amidase-like domain-containing protein [Xanthobacteraceae bacterium]|nr:N-acetylmuramoyl-L-alanine amidase-like domain-containing protein [Xanthobacteraceae bacterium]